jgi:hypothetical protein
VNLVPRAGIRHPLADNRPRLIADAQESFDVELQRYLWATQLAIDEIDHGKVDGNLDAELCSMRVNVGNDTSRLTGTEVLSVSGELHAHPVDFGM